MEVVSEVGGRRPRRTAAQRRAQRARAMGRAVSHLASAMLAIETHRGGQLSPPAALASALSRGRATVTEELQKAISMGLLDTAWLLGWEPEDTFPDDDEVLFSQRCRLYFARGSKWRQVAEGCGELRKNKFTRKVRFELRVESGFGWFAHFYAVRAPPFGVLVPLRVAGWKFYVIDCSLDDPTVQHVALVFASTELAGEFKVAFEEADRVNKMILEAG